MKCTIQNTGAMVDDPAVHMLRNSGEDDTPMLREHELKHCAGWVHQAARR